MRILGFPCSLTNPTWRRAIRTVLTRIHDQTPGDFEILRTYVRLVGSMSEGNRRSFGEWRLSGGNPPERDAQRHPGMILLYDEAPDDPGKEFDEGDGVCVFAHELGHAMTTADQGKRRARRIMALTALCGPSALRWARQCAANSHAYRWGFAREIRRFYRDHAKGRGFRCVPGALNENGQITLRILGHLGGMVPSAVGRFTITRNFYLKLEGGAERKSPEVGVG